MVNKNKDGIIGRISEYLETVFITYWIFATVRVILTVLPQTGYIHPDEYFQSIEVVSDSYFDIEVYKPWEYNVTFPIRSAFFQHLTTGFSYRILNALRPYWFQIFGRRLLTPYSLIVAPRLVMCALSFVNDYSLYKICRLYNLNSRAKLLTLATSYVTLTYATRTFSNSIELAFTSLLLYLVADCTKRSEKIILQSDIISLKYDKATTGAERAKWYKLMKTMPAHSLNHCSVIATISVLGVFNRPTFVAFALAPVFFWLHRGLGSRTIGFLDFHKRIIMLGVWAIPPTIFMILYDSFYFGYITWPEIHNLDISLNSFVVTPLNFIKYNMNVENLKEHGLHPRFLHFLVNLPLLHTVLGFLAILNIMRMVYSISKGDWLDLPRVQSIEGLMTASLIIPMSLLSLIAHQEPRFIIPVILPLVILYANHIFRISDVKTVKQSHGAHRKQNVSGAKRSTRKLQTAWIISNALLTILYGFVHQAGVFPLTSHLYRELNAKPHLTHLHIYTSHLYFLPTALLQLRNSNRVYLSSSSHKYTLNQDFHLYEKGDADMSYIYNDLASKVKECDDMYKEKKVPFRLYYAFPSSHLHDFQEFFSSNNRYKLKYHQVQSFFPHLSMEKLPRIKIPSGCLTNPSYCLMQLLEKDSSPLFNFAELFGLVLMRVEGDT